MKKILFYSLLFLFVSNIVFAQNTIVKTPPSFQFKNSLIQKSQIHRAVLKQDVSELRAEDMERIKNGAPMRVAVGIPVDFEFKAENACWLSMPDGKKIWQQSITSEGAEGLILSFAELYIPEGGELYIYTENREQVKVFTSETNPAGGIYASGVLFQDEIVLEYVQPVDAAEEARIKISDLGYVYNSQRALAKDVMTCYINVGCEEGDDWQLQKNGVVGLWISLKERNSRAWYICSGSLVNNVREDKTPYILTANHCIIGSDATTFATMEFDFFKESTSTNCTDKSEESTLTKTLTGATLIADIPISDASDGTLLQMKETIPNEWEVYYNGWDARGTAATSGVSIHHPNSMVKKISTFTQTLKTVGRIPMDDGVITGRDAHWEVNWAKTKNGQSVTYGGSSGSPLFNENGHIVGTLTGGNSYCQAPRGEDYYGKFSYHWDQYSDAAQHFKNFLDPDNTGTLVLDGYDPNAFDFEDNVPAAQAATDTIATGFTASWDELENATKYYLDVYRIEEDLSVSYADGYKLKNVGNVNSFAVSGLEPATQYYYVVRAGAGISSASKPSNEIEVTTKPALNSYSPVATEATNIEMNSFQANWEMLENATSYSLSVYQKTYENGENETFNYPLGYENLNVGNTLFYVVDNLRQNTHYYYTVVATDGIFNSQISNEISVKTADDPNNTSRSAILYKGEDIVIQMNTATDLAIYNIAGQLIASYKFDKDEVSLPSLAYPSGVYLFRLGNDVHKIVIK